MDGEELLRILDALERSGMVTWLDGGWGVDALLERQTRAHDDLDLVAALDVVPALQRVLADRGYSLAGGGAPMSFELVDAQGRQVDVHPVVFDEAGNGVYRMRDGDTWAYPAAGFSGRGLVLGRVVRCLTRTCRRLLTPAMSSRPRTSTTCGRYASSSASRSRMSTASRRSASACGKASPRAFPRSL